MKQTDYIKQIAKFALANDNARLRDLLYQYVEYSQQNNRANLQQKSYLSLKILIEKTHWGN
ncbi:hypothetical protein ACIXKX_12455 [Bacteroides fragilis]